MKKFYATAALIALTTASLTVFQNCSSSGLPSDLNASSAATNLPAVPDLVPNITPPPSLEISPNNVALAALAGQTFTAINGTPPYHFSLPGGCGSVGEANGVYSAPDATVNCAVTVRDSVGAAASATIAVSKAPAQPPQLAYAPTSLACGANVTLNGSGGTPGYTYSIAAGGNSTINGNVVTLRNTGGPVTLRVTDAVGLSASTTVNVPPNLPNGGYQSLCGSCTYSGTSMTCQCIVSVFNGGINTSTIDYATCPNSTVNGNGGTLRCTIAN